MLRHFKSFVFVKDNLFEKIWIQILEMLQLAAVYDLNCPNILLHLIKIVLFAFQNGSTNWTVSWEFLYVNKRKNIEFMLQNNVRCVHSLEMTRTKIVPQLIFLSLWEIRTYYMTGHSSDHKLHFERNKNCSETTDFVLPCLKTFSQTRSKSDLTMRF